MAAFGNAEYHNAALPGVLENQKNQITRKHASQVKPANQGNQRNPQLLVACGIWRASARRSGKTYGMEVF